MSTEQPAAPAWFELAAVLAASLVATVGLAGLALALLGWYRTPLALVLGVPLALAGVVAVRRALGGRAPAGRVAHAGAATAAVLALGFLVLASSAPSHHVLVNRDPGSYATTARWLARDGSLQVDGAAGGLEAEEPLTFESYAVYDVGDGRLQLQFNHLASVVMAVGHDLGGTRLMFRVPALVATAGLMSLYAVAVRMTGRPLASLLAPAALAATMPFLYVARDTFSEPFTMALLWSAVLAGSVAAATRRAGAGAVAGLLLGAAAATRADALLFVAIGLVLGGWWSPAHGVGRRRARAGGWRSARSRPPRWASSSAPSTCSCAPVGTRDGTRSRSACCGSSCWPPWSPRSPRSSPPGCVPGGGLAPAPWGRPWRLPLASWSRRPSWPGGSSGRTCR